METVHRLRPVRQVKVSRSERSSAYEKFWKTAILSAAIPKSTITSFILQFAFPIEHTVASTRTPVLDEIDDLLSAKDKDVEFVLDGKNLTLRTPRGRKIKAHLVKQKQC